MCRLCCATSMFDLLYITLYTYILCDVVALYVPDWLYIYTITQMLECA